MEVKLSANCWVAYLLIFLHIMYYFQHVKNWLLCDPYIVKSKGVKLPLNCFTFVGLLLDILFNVPNCSRYVLSSLSGLLRKQVLRCSLTYLFVPYMLSLVVVNSQSSTTSLIQNHRVALSIFFPFFLPLFPFRFGLSCLWNVLLSHNLS